MTITDYQAKYFAYELTRRHSADSLEKLGAVVAGAQVDLNPHQVDAALFAFRSPLSKGALLADEVGLGKTIEAGLVLSQRWAERRRRLLVIVPANLRKQWHQELSEKFFLPCRILESKSYNADIRQGRLRPFEANPEVVICSYQFAKAKASDVASTPWDLVVIDEAHRLRNVYKPTNIIANTLKQALSGRNKLLLTATPLQNSISELFGLVSIIDELTFGDLKSFREQFQYLTQAQVFATLKERLRPICHRTLRRQVTAYVPFTRRHPILEEFSPEESEDRLYELVSEYLRRDNLQALPNQQRSLMTLILRKLLASSTFAIAGALTTIANRLKVRLRQNSGKPEDLIEALDQDFEAADEVAEEWEEYDSLEPVVASLDRQALAREIADLEEFSRLATSIEHNAKGKALIRALRVAFKKAEELGAASKAIIFTESRRTQDYLVRVLLDSEFADGIVLFNGSNSDDRSKAIYADWFGKHEGTDRVSGSRTADMRSALVDYFREQGRIMIATEAGAEGINLQFCSLVVNYDLPWNPQRIEQRIGRCHRYGQKHDVVVVNFLNRKNEADQRVYQLLAEKFQLFEGVFGASDEVLGAIESGVDFERRISNIYQQCRRHEEIKTAFDQLQLELSFEIDETMKETRQKLLENFDDEVREKLKVAEKSSREMLGRFDSYLMRLAKHELSSVAEFVDEGSFLLLSQPFEERSGEIPLGRYELPRRSGDAHTFRLAHPLAEEIVNRAKGRALPQGAIVLEYFASQGKISVIERIRRKLPFEEKWVGPSGSLALAVLTVTSLGFTEDHLIAAAVTDDGVEIENEDALRLLRLSTSPRNSEPREAPAKGEAEVDEQVPSWFEMSEAEKRQLAAITEVRSRAIEAEIAAKAGLFFDAEAHKLDQWAEDLRFGLEREIRDLDQQIRAANRQKAAEKSLEGKLKALKQIKVLEGERNEKRRTIYGAQDEIDQRRDALIEQ
ncbi:MAG: DEAD/DEAH box helicase, partial [Thermoanaerobaculia bacterium]|nr:DEAD/DEAH box helicase [Thermoanaerobaculia bacterium]